MNTRTTAKCIVISVFLTAIGGCTRRDVPRISTTETTGAPLGSWQIVTRGWPEDSKSAAKTMVDKYGAPDEMTASQLIWNQRGPWKRSVLSRDPVHHEWPSPHEDVLEQVIAFRVPADMFDDLARFDGSVMAERTKGELSARCGGEAANFLALNLAKDIIDGKRNVADARHFYEEQMKAYKAGSKPEYLGGLRFSPSPDAADPDQAAPPR